MSGGEVEIFRTGSARSISCDDWITVRIGAAWAVMTAGEWSRLISNSQIGKPPVDLELDKGQA